MTEETVNSNDDQPSNLYEFRDMVNVALNSDVSVRKATENLSADEQTLNQALLSLDQCDENRDMHGMSTTTTVSVAELPSDITDSLNVAAKQLSLLYESVVNTTDHGEEVENEEVEGEEENGISDGLVEPCSNDVTGKHFLLPSTTSTFTTNSQQKRHIMISYNRSSRDICQKIYENLVERNYKVWMDLTDMAGDILESMARAVENSYIVLLCINQQYFESDYCKLEAQYAQENRIKFIPCLMEKSFRAQSWLGIIKGSNVHIDFSEAENFKRSFEELIREITFVEGKLSLQPRRTPAAGPMVNPMKFAAMSSSPKSATSTLTNDVNSRRFDTIIREYKRSINKKCQHLNKLKRNELADLIVKLRQELFNETSQILTDSERSDDEDEKKLTTDDQFLQQLLNRSLDQNDLLLTLVDRLTTPQPVQPTNSRNLDLDGIIKVIFAIMLLYTLNILCQKE